MSTPVDKVVFPRKDNDGQEKVAIHNLTVRHEGTKVIAEFECGKPLGRTNLNTQVWNAETQRLEKVSLPGQGKNTMLAKTSGVIDIKLPDGTMGRFNAMIFRAPKANER